MKKLKTISYAKYEQLRQVVSADVLAENFRINPHTIPTVALEEELQHLFPEARTEAAVRSDNRRGQSPGPARRAHLAIEVLGVPYVATTVTVGDLLEHISGIYQVEKRDGTVIYVGQAVCLKDRFAGHERADDEDVVFRILETEDCGTLTDRLALEADVIRQRLLEGHPLLNNCYVVKAFKRKYGR